MRAVIEKIFNGYVAKFERSFRNPPDKVWSALTDNVQLSGWMPNLFAVDLRKGGKMKFVTYDGSGVQLDLRISDYEALSALEFEWGKDLVRFEISPHGEGTLLVLKEYIGALTDHTPADLAGWHVCLDRLSALMEGRFKEFSMEEWKKRHEQYIAEVERLKAR